jgi:hypothetical protein
MPPGLAATGFVLGALGGKKTVLMISAVLALLAMYASVNRGMRTEDPVIGASTAVTVSETLR